jgi:hypothetical protein
MENLNLNELISINGGNECHPTVSSDSSVQSGYGIGWHIGHAIGNTVEMFADVVGTLGDAVSSWFN